MLKSINYKLYKLHKVIENHITATFIIVIIFTCFLSACAVVGSYHYIYVHDDIELNITVPSKLENGIDTQGLAKHSSPCNSLDKPITDDTVNHISQIHN